MEITHDNREALTANAIQRTTRGIEDLRRIYLWTRENDPRGVKAWVRRVHRESGIHMHSVEDAITAFGDDAVARFGMGCMVLAATELRPFERLALSDAALAGKIADNSAFAFEVMKIKALRRQSARKLSRARRGSTGLLSKIEELEELLQRCEREKHRMRCPTCGKAMVLQS